MKYVGEWMNKYFGSNRFLRYYYQNENAGNVLFASIGNIFEQIKFNFVQN